MKIEWLDEDFNRVRLVRRNWPKFWQKLECYVVHLDPGPLQWCYWYYLGTELPVGGGISMRLNDARQNKLLDAKARQHDAQWTKVTSNSLPEARVLKTISNASTVDS